jgi:hypothetical protein
MEETKAVLNETEMKRLAGLVADKLNEWLLDNHYDLIHDVCNDVVLEEYPNLEEEDFWEVVPDIFDRIVPFTSI